MFTKQEIIDRAAEIRTARGQDSVRADFNMALLVMSSALFYQRLRSGEDYGSHPVHVGLMNTRSNTKKIIGILHDVLEDSDWTKEDLLAVGFAPRIVNAVVAMTHKPDEPYFDAMERCSRNRDGRDKKIEDLDHNGQMRRNEALIGDKDLERQNKYALSHAFLVAVKKKQVAPGSSLPAYILSRPDYKDDARVHALLKKYSSHPGI